MEKIQLTYANESDLEWINLKYDEVKFVHSTLENESIVIAKEDGRELGLGRVQEVSSGTWELGGIYTFPEARGKGVARLIVSELLTVPKKGDEVFCIPFVNLLDFYGSFGFKKVSDQESVDPAILKKLNFCKSGAYESGVELLFMKK
jgi:predicted GNAT family N-acyltransferase